MFTVTVGKSMAFHQLLLASPSDASKIQKNEKAA